MSEGKSDAPKLQRVFETALYVEDLDQAARFYENVPALEAISKLLTPYAYSVRKVSVLPLFARGAASMTQGVPGGTIPSIFDRVSQ